MHAPPSSRETSDPRQNRHWFCRGSVVSGGRPPSQPGRPPELNVYRQSNRLPKSSPHSRTAELTTGRVNGSFATGSYSFAACRNDEARPRALHGVEYLENGLLNFSELGVPFVALRSGAFLYQIAAMGGSPFEKRSAMWLGDATVTLTFVLTDDLAKYLAAAVDADVKDGERIDIDIGWSRPISMREFGEIDSRHATGRINVRAIPRKLLTAVAKMIGRWQPLVPDMASMAKWFDTASMSPTPPGRRMSSAKCPRRRTRSPDSPSRSTCKSSGDSRR